MSSRVRAVTAGFTFARSTAKVPSAATRNAPASRRWLSWRTCPLPWASSMPKRIERKAEARKVVYIVRSKERSRTPLSTSCCSAHRPEMSAFASSMAP